MMETETVKVKDTDISGMRAWNMLGNKSSFYPSVEDPLVHLQFERNWSGIQRIVFIDVETLCIT